MRLTSTNGAALLIANNTISTTLINEDISLSGETSSNKVFLDGIDSMNNVRAPLGNLMITAEVGNIILAPASSPKTIAWGGFRVDEAAISTASDEMKLETALNVNILFNPSGSGAVAIGTDYAATPDSMLDVVGSVTAKQYLVDLHAALASSSSNYAPLSSLSSSSFSDIGLSKTFTLTAPAVVIAQYSLATTFRTSAAINTVGVQVSTLFLTTSGSETEENAGRSAQGYQATGTDSTDVTQTSNMATNTGMVIKSLAAGTHTFKVKTKHVMCGADCSAGYTDDLPNDPTSSTYFDGRSIQVIVLGSQS